MCVKCLLIRGGLFVGTAASGRVTFLRAETMTAERWPGSADDCQYFSIGVDAPRAKSGNAIFMRFGYSRSVPPHAGVTRCTCPTPAELGNDF